LCSGHLGPLVAAKVARLPTLNALFQKKFHPGEPSLNVDVGDP
jgi:hypothetical protein